jgi:hypothetical protein
MTITIDAVPIARPVSRAGSLWNRLPLYAVATPAAKVTALIPAVLREPS